MLKKPYKKAADNIEDKSFGSAQDKPFDEAQDKSFGSAQDKHIADLKSKIADLDNKWKRALADYQNLEKRTVNRIVDSVKYSAENIIIKLLPVLDTLDKAEKHLIDQGLALAVKSFRNVLESEGVVKIEVKGKKFNPHEMECVEVVESNKENEVIEELRAGYRLGDKVIRVAQVKVGKKKVNEKAEELAKEQLQKGDYM